MYEQYSKRFGFREKIIQEHPSSDLGIIVVIPAFNEASLIPTIASLYQNESCNCKVEILVVVNAAENTSDLIKQQNEAAKSELKSWLEIHKREDLQVFCIEENALPIKHAGVGLARKIGMDEAALRFDTIGILDGIIACFDADSICESNYLKSIESHFKLNLNSSACSIYFEHPVSGEEFEKQVYRGILYYELHLRYYRLGLAFAGLPYAFHTIGSSMAVRAKDYMKQGGMNKRKAGEDFYFLQKFIQLGNFSVLNDTRVIPSPRASERVPFGTGRAIREMLDGEREIECSYNVKVFILIKAAVIEGLKWFEEEVNSDSLLCQYFGIEFIKDKILEIKSNSIDFKGFEKRFFHWFNAFQCLKLVHYLRDTQVKSNLLIETVPQLLLLMGENSIKISPLELLKKLREIDRKQI